VFRIAAVIERWALAVWVGALAGFAFIFAPVAFSRLSSNLDTFASIVGGSLAALSLLGYACGTIAIANSLAGAIARRSRRSIARAICVAIMLALVAFSQRAVVPAMLATQARFGAPFSAIPRNDPRRVRYDALHAESSRIYGAVLVLGLGAIASW
jgi:hypothetical protein